MLTEPSAPAVSTRRVPPLGDHLVALLDAIADGVTVQDTSGQLVHANQMAAELCGFASANDLITADAGALPRMFELRDEAGQQIQFTDLPGRRVLSGEEPPEVLLLFITKATARERWVRVRCQPMRGPNAERWAVSTLRDVTPTVDTERRLRANERASLDDQRRLELALGAGSLGVLEWTVGDRRFTWSRGLEEMHGLEAGAFESTFEAFQRWIHPDDRSRVTEAIQQAVAARESLEVTYRIVLGDGEIRWIEIHGWVGDDDGDAHLVGVARDVTDQREAEAIRTRALAAEAGQTEAEKSRAKLAKIFDSITDPFSVLDRELRVVHINENAARMLGKPARELIGKSLLEMFPGSQSTTFHQAYKKVLASGKPTTVEEYYPPYDRWYEASLYPLEDGLAIYTRDVTMRKRAFELTTRLARLSALRADISASLADERDVRTMLRRICDAVVEHLEVAFARVWTADDSGENLLLQASGGMYTHIDGPHAVVPVGKFKIGRIAASRKAHLTNSVQTDPQVGDPAWAKRENMVAFAGYPLLVDAKLVGVFAMFAREQIPEDTLATLESIADLIAQGLIRRKTELELERKLEELARSNAELEQFAYVASHDLQEPLRMVASYNQLLARRYKGKLGEDADEFIGFSVEGVTRMQRLINDLLQYSRVGTRTKEKVSVGMMSVIDNTLRNLETLIKETEAVITYDELPHVLGDEVQLLQLMQNLIGNAIKFRRDDVAPHVHIGLINNGFGYTFSVRDNGIGIDPQFFDRIFVIFQRLNPREKYPGTGIGLAICMKIVERHNGRIWVESAPDKGTTIHFTLPHQPQPRRTP